MKIQKITYQHRRDFKAVYECQFCGYTYEGTGYDDDNYHQNVIPGAFCPKCHKSTRENADELTEEYRPLTTKYPEGFQI